jgi:hypothetical protein
VVVGEGAAAVVRVGGPDAGAGARRERRGGAEVGPAGVGRPARGRGRWRAALDLGAGPALRRGAARGRGVAAAARALVLAPLEQHLAAAADPGGARGGGVGEVGVVLVVAVVARGAPGRDGGGGRGRRGLRRRLRSASPRLGLERCRGQERREAGAVGGDGRRGVVLARSRGRHGRRLPAAANTAAAGDAIGEREAI